MIVYHQALPAVDVRAVTAALVQGKVYCGIRNFSQVILAAQANLFRQIRDIRMSAPAIDQVIK